MSPVSTVSTTRRMISTGLLLVLTVVFVGVVTYRWPQISAYLVAENPPRGPARAEIKVPPVGDEFDPVTVINRSFPAITEVPVARVQDVSNDQSENHVADNELVLGIEIGGEARAYPINMLTGPEREIINDELGGTAIAATW